MGLASSITYGINSYLDRKQQAEYQKQQLEHQKQQLEQQKYEQGQKLFDHLNSQRLNLSGDLPTLLSKESEAYDALQRANMALSLGGDSPVIKQQAEMAARRYDVVSNLVISQNKEIQELDRATRMLAVQPPPMQQGGGERGMAGENFERPAYASPSEEKQKAQEQNAQQGQQGQAAELGQTREQLWRSISEAAGISLKDIPFKDGQFTVKAPDDERAKQYTDAIEEMRKTYGVIPPIYVDNVAPEAEAAKKEQAAAEAKAEKGRTEEERKASREQDRKLRRKQFLDQRIDATTTNISIAEQKTKDLVLVGAMTEEEASAAIKPLKMRRIQYLKERNPKQALKEFAQEYVKEHNLTPPLDEKQSKELKAEFDAIESTGE